MFFLMLKNIKPNDKFEIYKIIIYNIRKNK